MSKYLVEGTDLTSVANAIRTKGGTSASLGFPSDFITAIGNISGGGSVPAVTGTFTGTTAGSAITVSVPYTGNGYPIALMIFPSTGAYKTGSSIYSLAKKYAIVAGARIKRDTSSTPTYSGSGEENKGCYFVLYKNSDSDATIGVTNGALDGTMFTADSAGSTAGTVMRINSSTQFSVMIADSSYGFVENIEYTYWMVYSA